MDLIFIFILFSIYFLFSDLGLVLQQPLVVMTLQYAYFSKALNWLSSSGDYKRTRQGALAVLLPYLYKLYVVHTTTMFCFYSCPKCQVYKRQTQFLFISFSIFFFFSFYFLIFLFLEHRVRVRSQDTENEVEGSRTNDVIQHKYHMLTSCSIYGHLE